MNPRVFRCTNLLNTRRDKHDVFAELVERKNDDNETTELTFVISSAQEM